MAKQRQDYKQKHALAETLAQPMLFPMDANEQTSVSSQETWFRDIARTIENEVGTSAIADLVLPLLLYKYLSDALDSSSTKYTGSFASNIHSYELFQTTDLERERTGPKLIHIPSEFSWDAIRNYPPDGTLRQFLTLAMHEVARLNPHLRGVVDIENYDGVSPRLLALDDKLLKKVIDVISLRRLDTKNGSLEVLNAAYEYLLQHFSGTRDNAARFFTPKATVKLMLDILEPSPESSICDPACGSGGFLCHALYALKGEEPKLYGQESTPIAYAMAKLNMLLQDSSAAPNIFIGDALREPCFIDEDGSLKRFDRVLANPPWNLKGYDKTFYETDKWGRFKYGTPPEFSADWGWVEHILASLGEDGRAGVLLDIGAVSRGSEKERDIRRSLVERDLIEGVILLPGKLFYGTAVPCVALILRKNKPADRKGQTLFVDASDYVSQRGTAVLSDEDIEMIYKAYSSWETQENLCRVITLEELRSLEYDLSPLLLVGKKIEIHYRSLHEIERDLTDALRKRERADTELIKMLNRKGTSSQVGYGEIPLAASTPLLRMQPTTAEARRTRLEAKKLRKQLLSLERERRAALMQQFFTYGIRNEPTHLTALGQIPVDWAVMHLKEHTEIRSGFTPSPLELRREGKQIPWVRASDLYQGHITSSAKTIPESITDDKYIRRAVRPVDTVLIAVYGGPSTVGKTGILRVQAATNQSVCCISPDTEFLDAYYLLCYLTYIRPSWIRYAIGSRLNITMNIVKERLVPLPSIEVQQEIANRLRPFNAIISDLEQEIAIMQGEKI